MNDREMKCRYETPCSKRCLGTKEIDPCCGYDKCKEFRPNYTTQADRIRSMSDEDLAEYLASLFEDIEQGIIYSANPDRWLEWLEEEA